jgi:hypothetical protein
MHEIKLEVRVTIFEAILYLTGAKHHVHTNVCFLVFRAL